MSRKSAKPLIDPLAHAIRYFDAKSRTYRGQDSIDRYCLIIKARGEGNSLVRRGLSVPSSHLYLVT
jgi:hypothetical protein